MSDTIEIFFIFTRVPVQYNPIIQPKQICTILGLCQKLHLDLLYKVQKLKKF